MGNFYANAFSSSLKSYGSIEKMILASNRLTEVGSYQILSSMNMDNLTCIDLSHNLIGKNSVKIIISVLSNNRMPLRRLYLENVNL